MPQRSGREIALAGRYLLVDLLGSGGMGSVYRARDTKLVRQVAIKVLPTRRLGDPDAVARFEREAKALAKLSHAGIVQVYDSGQDDERHFLVMEYIEGEDLAAVLRAKKTLSPARSADYICQTCRALEHAHAKGLVHRDLKPSNLLITPSREVKILDLGLARFFQDQLDDSALTREGCAMGTPDYMAPEQFHDSRLVDARSDIYALGCTLYHVLSGQPPFPGTSLSAKRESHERHEPEALEQLCDDVPAGLAPIVRRMMAKKPDERFASAREVAEALAPYAAGVSASSLRLSPTSSWQGNVAPHSDLPVKLAKGAWRRLWRSRSSRWGATAARCCSRRVR
jgi:serine/threonine protein kinase